MGISMPVKIAGVHVRHESLACSPIFAYFDCFGYFSDVFADAALTQVAAQSTP